MLLACFVGCKKQDEDGEETTVSTTVAKTGDGSFTDSITRQNAQSSLPELNYGGKLIRYLTRDREDTAFEINPDTVSDEALSQAVYNRNEYVKNTLNVELEIIPKSGNFANQGEYMQEIRNNANGPDYYDIVSGPNYALVPLAMEGYFRNIHSLDYIDTEKPWWNKNFIDKCTYRDKLYTIEGELSLSMIDSAFVMFYNKTTFNDANKGVNIYDIVKNDEWTFAKFKSFVSSVWDDTGAQSGTPDTGDAFGYVSPSFACGRDGYPAAFGATVAERDANGNIIFTFDNSNNFDKWGAFYEFLAGDSGVFVPGANDQARTDTMDMFQAGRAMFITELLHYSSTLRTMEVEYGVLPLPKYDSNQTNYGTSSEAVHSQFAIPRAGTQNEEASAVLELLCFETYRNVTLTYFESTLKAKNMKDAESTEMLDIVVASITCDFGAYYSTKITWPFPVIGTEKDLGSYVSQKRGMMTPKLNDLVSTLDSLPD